MKKLLTLIAAIAIALSAAAQLPCKVFGITLGETTFDQAKTILDRQGIKYHTNASLKACDGKAIVIDDATYDGFKFQYIFLGAEKHNGIIERATFRSGLYPFEQGDNYWRHFRGTLYEKYGRYKVDRDTDDNKNSIAFNFYEHTRNGYFTQHYVGKRSSTKNDAGIYVTGLDMEILRYKTN